MRKKCIAIVTSLFMCCSLAACSGSKDEATSMDNGGGTKLSEKEMAGSDGAAADDSTSCETGADDSAASDSTVGDSAAGDAKMNDIESHAASDPAGEEDIAAGKEIPIDEEVPADESSEVAESAENIDYKAGTLTAGEWSDNDNWGFFMNLVSTENISIPSYGMTPVNRIKVNVTNGKEIVENAVVRLESKDEKVIYTSRTDYSGTAYVFYSVFGTEDTPDQITVSIDGKVVDSQKVDMKKASNESGQNKNQTEEKKQTAAVSEEEINFNIDKGSKASGTDIMFLFDTTGSMGDELMYLQKEFSDISERIGDKNARFSVDFYRDQGDAYVTKFNEFTSSSEAQKQLNLEAVDGGGDYEEAVDEALKEAVSADWKENSVKLLFIVLDAPPHDDKNVYSNLREVVEKGAGLGIRIIPIASSGVDINTEVVMRSLALMTGGTYTFLTDDSGVGGSHMEPTIGKYDVQKLNDMIVNIINRYTGKK